MCRRCRRIYIRHPLGARRSPSHLSLLDSRENYPSPCDPALSPTSLTSACDRSQGPTQTQSISMPPHSGAPHEQLYAQTVDNCKEEAQRDRQTALQSQLVGGLTARYETSTVARVHLRPLRGGAWRPRPHAPWALTATRGRSQKSAHQGAEHGLVDSRAVPGLGDARVLVLGQRVADRRIALYRVRDQPADVHLRRACQVLA